MNEIGAIVEIPDEGGRRGRVLQYDEDADAVRVGIEGSPVVRWYLADQVALVA